MGAVVSDPNGLTWAATLVPLAVTIPTAGHAVIFKRDPRSATLWVLLIALLPLGGSLLYGLFGINRLTPSNAVRSLQIGKRMQ